MRRKLRVLVLFDFPITPPDEHYEKYVQAADWRPNRNVIEAIEKLGHEVHTHAVYNRLDPFIEKLHAVKPDIVFNLAESFDMDRRHEGSLVALMELLKCAYTGNSSLVLALCGNKFYTNRLLTHQKIKVPRAILFPRGVLNRSLRQLRYPCFVKPLGLAGSDGIAKNSFAEDAESCIKRVTMIHEHHHCDALVEEYVEGREIYSGVIGNSRLRTLPPREMIFAKFPDDEPKFATFKAKWDDDFRKKWGIKNTFADNLDAKVLEKIGRVSRTAYKTLGLQGYGRLDLRVTAEGEVYLIEVNPNPDISNDGEIALGAARIGIKYMDLVQKILDLGLQAHQARQ